MINGKLGKAAASGIILGLFACGATSISSAAPYIWIILTAIIGVWIYSSIAMSNNVAMQVGKTQQKPSVPQTQHKHCATNKNKLVGMVYRKTKCLLLATQNKGKVAEFAQYFTTSCVAGSTKTLGIPEAVEDGGGFVDNALIKARHAAKHTDLPFWQMIQA